MNLVRIGQSRVRQPVFDDEHQTPFSLLAPLIIGGVQIRQARAIRMAPDSFRFHMSWQPAQNMGLPCPNSRDT